MSRRSSPTSPATPTSANTCCNKALAPPALRRPKDGRAGGRMKLFHGLAVIALALSIASAGAETQQVDWRQAARQDVLAAYDIYADNHPGMKDPGNPRFPAQL